MQWKKTLTLVVVALLAVSVIYYSKNDHVTSQEEQVSIGIATWAGFAPAIYAAERGYFGDVSARVDVVDDFNARRAAYMSGKHDFTIYTVDSLAFDAGHGVSGKIVLILDESRGADGIVAKQGYTTSDLKGSKIAYTHASPSHYFLIDFLKSNEISSSEIDAVTVDDPVLAANVFQSGTVDAAVTFEPYLSQLVKESGAVLLADTAKRPGKIVDVLVASEKVLRERPEVVQQVVQGWLRALQDIHNPQLKDEAFKVMAQGLKMPVEDFSGMAAGIVFADLKGNIDWLGENTGRPSKSALLFQDAVEVWLEESQISEPLNPSDYINPEFVLNLEK